MMTLLPMGVVHLQVKTHYLMVQLIMGVVHLQGLVLYFSN